VEVLAHELGMLEIKRARVRLLLGDTNLGQIINQNFRFDLKLSRQFVNSDLICV
jgi:hypothetical protein